MLVSMTNRIPAVLVFIFLTACSTYEVKDAGDGVYYAESPPEYTYVDGYVFGRSFWHSSYYYSPFWSSCWHTPYAGYYCHWPGAPFIRHEHIARDFAMDNKYPVAGTGKYRYPTRPAVMPVAPVSPANSSVADSRSLKYATAQSYEGAKINPGKRSYSSSSSAFGKRTMKAPAQSYSRPARTSKAARSSISIKAPVNRKLD